MKPKEKSKERTMVHNDLPTEIWQQILSYLSLADILSLQWTSRRLREISRAGRIFHDSYQGCQPFTHETLQNLAAAFTADLEKHHRTSLDPTPPLSTSKSRWYHRLRNVPTQSGTTQKKLLTFGSVPDSGGPIWRVQVLLTATMERCRDQTERVHFFVKWIACYQVPISVEIDHIHQFMTKSDAKIEVSPHPCTTRDRAALGSLVPVYQGNVAYANLLASHHRRHARLPHRVCAGMERIGVRLGCTGGENWTKAEDPLFSENELVKKYQQGHCVHIQLLNDNWGTSLEYTLHKFDSQHGMSWVEGSRSSYHVSLTWASSTLEGLLDDTRDVVMNSALLASLCPTKI